MKKFSIIIPALLAVGVLVSQPTTAQEKEEKKEKPEKAEKPEKPEKPEKDKWESNEEIIIKRKNDKDSKVTIEIKGDEITVNGKPLDDYDNDDIVVQKRRSKVATIYSPFRGQSGALSFEGHPMHWNGSDVPFLGVSTEKNEKGARVEDVNEGSAADKAGLKPGDIITKIGDDTIDSPEDLSKVVRGHKPDDKITITYEREGKTATTTAKIGKRKSIDFVAPRINTEDFKFEMPAMPNSPDAFGGRAYTFAPKGRLGIKAQDTEDGKGVKVIDVDGESIAEKAGVKEGDVITEFDGKKVNSADELSRYAREARDKPSVKIDVTREGKSKSFELKTPRKLKTANL